MKKEGNSNCDKLCQLFYSKMANRSRKTAVQNERDRISSRRPSYEEPVSANGLTISVLINAETMSRQVNFVVLFNHKVNKPHRMK